MPTSFPNLIATARDLTRTHPFRTAALASLLFCLAAFAAVFYLQFVTGLKPCPLCTLQRLPTLWILLLSALACTLPSQGALRWKQAIAGLCTFGALAGLGLAARHLWLQQLPPEQVPSCGPDLGELLNILPWSEALQMVLAGDGSCAEVQWSFLGLSIPGMAALAFGALALGWGGLLLWSLLPGPVRKPTRNTG